MDRERLKEVRQTDLTESRINQDFVDWLKTKGVNWLLVVVVALFAYVAMVRWNQHRVGTQTRAWTSLAEAELPGSLEDVADKYSHVGAVPHLARLQAAARLLNAVQTGRTVGAAETATELDDETRAKYLEDADRLYGRVVQSDDQSQAMTLVVTNALSGRAAVAESRGDLAQARQYYMQAAQRAEAFYPRLAQQAQERAATVEERAGEISLPTRAQLLAIQQMPAPSGDVDPVWSEPWVSDLVAPPQ